jgi:hypothetical protein
LILVVAVDVFEEMMIKTSGRSCSSNFSDDEER